jgi:adenine-specific DNA methylase
MWLEVINAALAREKSIRHGHPSTLHLWWARRPLAACRAVLFAYPFCGGGSIPLEAQRLGLEAHASDLNPVAVLITKALIEIPPKFAGQPPVNPEARKKMQTTLSGGKDWKGAEGLA